MAIPQGPAKVELVPKLPSVEPSVLVPANVVTTPAGVILRTLKLL